MHRGVETQAKQSDQRMQGRNEGTSSNLAEDTIGSIISTVLRTVRGNGKGAEQTVTLRCGRMDVHVASEAAGCASEAWDL